MSVRTHSKHAASIRLEECPDRDRNDPILKEEDERQALRKQTE
jgi:hypothetical protein